MAKTHEIKTETIDIKGRSIQREYILYYTDGVLDLKEFYEGKVREEYKSPTKIKASELDIQSVADAVVLKIKEQYTLTTKAK